MLNYNNLYELILSVLVALIYAMVVYVTSPVRTVKFKTGILYMLVGMLSVGILHIFYKVFPFWNSKVVMDNIFFTSTFVLCFIQIAFAEELSKLVSFKINDLIFNKDRSLHPNAFVFYAGMNALGFAIVENMQYLGMFGVSVLEIRAVTATVLHLLTGIVLGYFMALGRVSRVRTRSVLERFLKSKPILKKWIYTLVGFLSAMFLHGIYNYNAMVSKDFQTSLVITFMILLITTLIMGILVNNLEKGYMENKWKDDKVN